MTIVRRGKSWRVSVYAGTDGNGHERRLTATVRGTKSDARDVEGTLRKKARRALGVDPPGTFGELLDAWSEVARHEASTKTRTDSYVEKHIRPAFGRHLVTKLTTAELDRFYLDLDRTLAASTVRRIHGIVHAALEQAVTWDWIERNPASRARLPELPGGGPAPPDVDQVKRLLGAAAETDPALFVFMRLCAVTSMRKGEVCALRRSDVDLEHGVIRRAAAIGEAKGGPYLKATKTGLRDRLSIDVDTIELLRGYLATQDTDLAGFGPLDPDAFLFSNEADHTAPWRPDHVAKRFARVRDHAGVAGVQIRELRHFGATELVRAGFSARTVGNRLGHSKPTTTMTRYAGDTPADDRHAADFMGERLR